MADRGRIRVALLYGGKSGEHEVSLLSASSVLRALDTNRYDVIPMGCDKEGTWFKTEVTTLLANDAKAMVPSLPSSTKISLNPSLFDDIDVVLPIMHGPLYEDGCLQGFLDLCNVAYVGSGTLSSALAMDKVISKQLAMLGGINVVEFISITSTMNEHEKQTKMKAFIDEFSFPLFVKPARMGSSVGIEKVSDEKSLHEAIGNAFRYDEKILIERGVQGREIELAVLEGEHDLKVSLAGEIKMEDSNEFYSYDAKYVDKDAAKLILPADLDKTLLSELQASSKTIFRLLECNGLGRVDFFVEEKTNQVLFNELNTLPGFTEISMYPKLWVESGISYSELITSLINAARWRFERRNKLVRDIL